MDCDRCGKPVAVDDVVWHRAWQGYVCSSCARKLVGDFRCLPSQE